MSALYQSIENCSPLSISVRITRLRRSVLSHFLFSTLRAVDRGVSPQVGLVSKTESGRNCLEQSNENMQAINGCAWFFMLITVVIEFLSYVKVGAFLVTFCR